ncbi:hypothetical protein PC116_g3512 [Phytophthora cactorum]|nr:hypothetical protein PC116_g3512 [Phytophthora cactorum]
MTDGTSHATSTEVVDARAIRDACLSQETRNKYTVNINGIKKWIGEVPTLKDRNTARFFGASDEISLAEFTPAFFEQLLVYKRGVARLATLSGYCSAIKNLYRLKRIVLPMEYGYDMKQLFYGINAPMPSKAILFVQNIRASSH